MAIDGRELEERNTARRAKLLGLRYLDTRTLVQQPIYKDLIPLEEMRTDQLVPIISTDEVLTVGITTTTPSQQLENLRQQHNNRRVRYVLISPTALDEYLNLYDPPQAVDYDDLQLETAFDAESVQKTGQALANVKADDMLAYIVNQAFRLRASDIHCENAADYTDLRMRIDGALHPIARLSKDQYRILLSAIASAANLSTAAKDAQTGRISQQHAMEDGQQVLMNLRVETIPAIHGTDIVMRFFSFTDESLALAKLGMNETQIQIINDIIKYPRGLVLIVGPTGSGKTTTLYSLLSELRQPQLKIITLEDPVEYELTGVTQIPIDSYKGASFATGLRTVLRLDPDVVMLGEIRDEDTAGAALQAALTGHLVLSTYHAASTALALTSILQLAAKNPLFLNAIRLIQAQRLVRRLDDQTKQAYQPSAVEKAHLQQMLDTFDPSRRPVVPADFKLYRPQPSPAHPFGFAGQIAIRELLVLDDELRLFLTEQGRDLKPSQLETYLHKQGKLTTMMEEGISRVLAGETTLEEIYRSGV